LLQDLLVQWGDEGKGKIVDVTSNYDIIARFKEDPMLDIH
jgi:adenylosuccinate synthase